MQQLEEDLERDHQEETLLAQGEGWKKEKGTVSARILLQQITLLRGDLKGVEGAMGRLSSAATPSGGGDKDGTRGTGRVSLSERMKEMDEHDKGVVSAVGVAEVAQGKERVVGQGGGVGRKREPSNLRELEARITQLELNLGTSESTLDEVSSSCLFTRSTDRTQNRPLPPPLLQSVQSLTSLLSLLTQPRTLELVTRRIKSLIHDLEKLTESRKKLGDSSSLESCVFFYRKEEGGEVEGGMNVLGDRERERKMIPPSLLAPESPNEDDLPTSSSTTNASLTPMQTYQLNTLTSLVPSITPLVPLAPRLLSRLQSLKTLHSSAQEFNLSLSSLESVTSQTQSSVRRTTATMEVLEENMRRNEEAAGRNLEGLQGRIESLLGRLDALTSASPSKEY